MTQETEEVLEMTEIPEEVMQEEGITVEDPRSRATSIATGDCARGTTPNP